MNGLRGERNGPGADPSTVPSDRAFLAELGRAVDSRAADLQEQIADRQTQLRDTQQIQRFLAAFSDACTVGPSAGLRVLASHKKQLELLKRFDADQANRLQALGPELRAAAEAIFEDIPRDFPAALEKHSLALDPNSRHPGYSLLDEFIQVRFDKKKLEATVHPRNGRKTMLGIELGVVAPYLAAEVNRLTMRPFEPTTVLATLEGAYRAARTADPAGGDNVPLKTVVKELAKNDTFRADEFNIDLSKLIRDKASNGRVELDNVRDAENGILLWQLDQRGYYGYIRVKGDGDGS